MGKSSNPLIQFADTNRTTTFFRDYAITQIKLAYRIMEYLAPDDTYPPDDISTTTKELMLREKFDEAFGWIENEPCIDDFNSSHYYEETKALAKELMAHLLPLYLASCKSAKEQRRQELLRELGELDNG